MVQSVSTRKKIVFSFGSCAYAFTTNCMLRKDSIRRMSIFAHSLLFLHVGLRVFIPF